MVEKRAKKFGHGQTPPLIRAMPERKRFFFIEAFPYFLRLFSKHFLSCFPTLHLFSHTSSAFFIKGFFFCSLQKVFAICAFVGIKLQGIVPRKDIVRLKCPDKSPPSLESKIQGGYHIFAWIGMSVFCDTESYTEDLVLEITFIFSVCFLCLNFMTLSLGYNF